MVYLDRSEERLLQMVEANMPKQVPEEKKRLSEEEQLAKLREELAGNKAFGLQRGRWEQRLIDLLLPFVEADSPTQAVKRFDAFAADARVMVQKLARLRRDREKAAFEMMNVAMRFADRIIPGETFPLEQTRPITLVMFDFERTFFVNEATKSSRWQAPYWAHMGHDCSLLEVNEFGPLFPHWRDDATGNFPISVLAKIFWNQMKRELHLDKKVIVQTRFFEYWPETVVKDGLAFDFGAHWLWLKFPDSLGMIQRLPVAAWYEGRPDVFLRLFTREEQRLIRTWSFDCPRVVEPDAFAFHDEGDHARWRKEEPALMSLNVSEGLGVAITPLSFLGNYQEQTSVRLFLSQSTRLS